MGGGCSFFLPRSLWTDRCWPRRYSPGHSSSRSGSCSRSMSSLPLNCTREGGERPGRATLPSVLLSPPRAFQELPGSCLGAGDSRSPSSHQPSPPGCQAERPPWAEGASVRPHRVAQAVTSDLSLIQSFKNLQCKLLPLFSFWCRDGGTDTALRPDVGGGGAGPPQMTRRPLGEGHTCLDVVHYAPETRV